MPKDNDLKSLARKQFSRSPAQRGALMTSSDVPRATVDPPSNYGEFWKNHDGGLEWYTSMYESRLAQHSSFQNWFRFIDAAKPVQSVLEIGCGLAVGYADFFKDLRYAGVDVATQLIDWCRANRENSRHQYIADDFIADPPREKFDLVFSQGTIDNTYDMDAFLGAMVAATRRWIYVTAYRGFFPELTEHRLTWCKEQGVYYNDISPHQAYRTLEKSGCRNIMVFPAFTGQDNISHETVIIGSAPHDA